MKRWMVWVCAMPVTLACAAGSVLSTRAMAQTPSRTYAPIPLTPGREVNDRLADTDIPTGDGNFARDYLVQLQAGDQIAIDLSSDNFDTIVALMSTRGATIAENDDGSDGTTNSLLFTRIARAGNYIVRVKAFGETAGGPFKLKLTRLRPTP
ncbi:PPC domain-containing protein [Cyanobacteria bacterium FACHB-DQ100]|uniref:DVUA0089 family protein n=1 Tax=Leptolyngbya sp. DQ-M1 TaxID=2933920 RepID=UPI0019A48FBA|nr:PPC domain-containing protein [Cyanobacteria bacterium FACHB-DQ100]